MSDPANRLDDLRTEYRELINSWEYAFAMGHRQSIGYRPESADVLRRVADLRAAIAELEED
jgi:hypothetical protein